MSALSGLAAVFAAAGLASDVKDGGISRAALDAAVTAALAEGEKAGLVKAGGEPVKADRARTKAILGHANAKGREDLAHHLAFETDMSAEAAAAMLAKAPAGAVASKLDGKVPDPNVTSDDAAKPDPAASWDAAVSLVNKANARR